MNNPFNSTHRHNLDIGIQNAINAIKSGCYDQAIELLSNTQEMLSLIDVEQEGWVSVEEVPPIIDKEYWVYGIRGYDQHPATYRSIYRKGILHFHYWECWDLREDEELKVSHYREIPPAPITLKEAQLNNMSQSVEIEGDNN